MCYFLFIALHNGIAILSVSLVVRVQPKFYRPVTISITIDFLQILFTTTSTDGQKFLVKTRPPIRDE